MDGMGALPPSVVSEPLSKWQTYTEGADRTPATSAFIKTSASCVAKLSSALLLEREISRLAIRLLYVPPSSGRLYDDQK